MLTILKIEVKMKRKPATILYEQFGLRYATVIPSQHGATFITPYFASGICYNVEIITTETEIAISCKYKDVVYLYCSIQHNCLIASICLNDDWCEETHDINFDIDGWLTKTINGYLKSISTQILKLIEN